MAATPGNPAGKREEGRVREIVRIVVAAVAIGLLLGGGVGVLLFAFGDWLDPFVRSVQEHWSLIWRRDRP